MNILSVDLEDWFHICEVDDLLPRKDWDRLPSTVVEDTERLLEVLRPSGARATFFVLGWVAARHPALIETIHGMGHEIAYHGWSHELVYDLRPEELRSILRRGKKKIREITGREPMGFRAPQWSANDRAAWAPRVLAEEGFLYDSSRSPLRIIGSERYPVVPHRLDSGAGELWELPPFTVATPWGRCPAGGGWGLRVLPYPLLRRQVRSLNRRGAPALFFLHPREFGAPPPIPGLPLAKRFVLGGKVWSTRFQLERLLKDFTFTSIEGLLASRHPTEGAPQA